ncbi:MAG TPA: hypothetical protein VK970_09110, partial [Candidatus Methylacidiphilales bacterium]|nr:hypothetical protein [Candidatus Methylacidiphilales bacterium]
LIILIFCFCNLEMVWESYDHKYANRVQVPAILLNYEIEKGVNILGFDKNYVIETYQIEVEGRPYTLTWKKRVSRLPSGDEQAMRLKSRNDKSTSQIWVDLLHPEDSVHQNACEYIDSQDIITLGVKTFAVTFLMVLWPMLSLIAEVRAALLCPPAGGLQYRRSPGRLWVRLASFPNIARLTAGLSLITAASALLYLWTQFADISLFSAGFFALLFFAHGHLVLRNWWQSVRGRFDLRADFNEGTLNIPIRGTPDNPKPVQSHRQLELKECSAFVVEQQREIEQLFENRIVLRLLSGEHIPVMGYPSGLLHHCFMSTEAARQLAAWLNRELKLPARSD